MRLNGNIVHVGSRAVGWYRLAPQQWNWRSEADRDALILCGAQVLAALTGHRLHFRVTSASLTRQAWAARLDGGNRLPLPAWAAHQSSVADHLTRLDLHEKAAFVGVELGAKSAAAGLLAGLLGRKPVQDVAAVVGRPGWDARPVTVDELEWLVRRSVLLGHPSPKTSACGDLPWDEDDLPEITDAASWAAVPYGRSVAVTVDGVTRHVVTSVIGRMQTLSSRDPWLCLVDRLPYDVEISATIDVLPGEVVQRGVRSMIMRALNQREHYGEHGLPPPQSLQAGIDAALEVQAELDQGFGTDIATRCDGWYRLSVSGETEAEALARADEIAGLYSPLVTIVRPSAQYGLARELIPGERLSSTAYRRRMPVTTAAGAVPQASAVVGHQAGFYVGYTSGAGGRHAVMWDPWRSTEVRERSGLAVVVGGLGSGKSSLLGSLAFCAALSGVQTTVLDPSGPLSALCDLPELGGRARHIDLLSARPGILNPWRLIPTPPRGHFASDAEHAHAVELAGTTRRTLAADVLIEMLPKQIADQAETLIVIRNACREASAFDYPSPRRVLEALRTAAREETDTGIARQARVVGDLLGDLATLPAAQLIFESGVGEIDYVGLDHDPILTVITMNGLQIPREGSDRRDLSTDEILSLPLLHLSAWLVQRSVYHGDRHARKLVAFDEVHALSRIGAGRLLLNTSARDSRKWNARILLASQNAADLLEAGVSNLVDCVWVGRTEDPEAQAEALRLLRVPEGAGFEQALAALSPHSRGHAGRSGGRDFVWADGEHGIERVRVDLAAYGPGVRAALDTTADPTRSKIPA